MATPEQNAKLAEFAKLAVASERECGMPAEATCAQWVAESGYGAKETGKNNIFGIKRVRRHTQGQWCLTTEEYNTEAEMRADVSVGNIRNPKVTGKRPNGRIIASCEAQFAAFDTPMDALRDRAELLQKSSLYSKHWQTYQRTKDVDQYVRGIAGVYATGSGYADLLAKIARQDNVKTACAKARVNGVDQQ